MILITKLFSAIIASFIAATLANAQQKRIYIANDDHTDYMWSGDENTYRKAFVNMLDFYIRKADSTISIGLPTEQQSRFNCDGSFWLWTYEQNKTQPEVARLIDKIRTGHISVPFNALASTYGGTPAEAILRGMYYAGSLERRFNLDLDLAVAMEDQTHPLGLASLWAGAGAKYSWKGVCACATQFGPGKLDDRNKEVYWYTGLDGKKVLMKWYSLNDTIPPGGRSKNESLGGYGEARNPSYAVEACKKKFNAANYDTYQAAGAFGYGWDDLQSLNSDGFINAAKTKTDESYRVIVSNEKDFFTDFEAAHGASLESSTVTFGNDWDLLCTSLAETSAKVKRSLEKLRSAESMAVLVTLKHPAFGITLDSARIKAWMGYGVYWEHDWTVDGNIVPYPQRTAWQRKIESHITDYTNQLYDSAADELGKQITKKGTYERFFVFNPLSWIRTDFADYPCKYSGDVHVMDIFSKAQVPHQVIKKNESTYVRILASNVPSVGYKVFEIGPGKGEPFQLAATALHNNTVIENSLFKVSINNTGVITSILDKRNKNRECIANGKANDLGSSSKEGTIAVENPGGVSVTLKAESTDPLPHISRITLYKDLPRIDIENQVTQNFKDVRRWTFDLNLKTPETWHEEAGAVIKARLDSHGGHYSSVNALYNYQTLNHFVSVNETDYGITLSNRDCYFMQLGNSTLTILDETAATLNVLAGGRASLPDLGIPDQGGDSLFNQSFSLGTHKAFDKAAEMRFALEHQNPFVTGEVTGEKSVYPEKTYSSLTITDPHVLLWALKPAEEGYASGGIIARVWNLGSTGSSGRLKFNSKIMEAKEVSHVETDVTSASYTGSELRTSIPLQGMVTYRLKFSAGR